MSENKGNRKSCQCSTCQKACTYRPGWFLPGEMESAAESMGMTPQKFFNKYVGVDYHYADDNVDNDVFILAPVNGTCVPGSEYPYKPIGEDCVFYNNEKCSIHDVKPHECASYLHGDSHQESMELKLKIVTAWNTDENQQRIKDLLGRDPKTSFPSSFFEAFELF